MYFVENIEVDYIGYEGKEEENNYQVWTTYISENTCEITVERQNITEKEGWNINLVLLVSNKKGLTKKLHIGSSSTNKKTILFDDIDFQPFVKSQEELELYVKFNRNVSYNVYHATIEEFNREFECDLVCLPSSMFAVGFKNGTMLQYHENYELYSWNYEIEKTITHMAEIFFSSKLLKQAYFIIHAKDGYLEGYYDSVRYIPKIIKENELVGKDDVYLDPNTEQHMYPVLHKDKYVLTMCAKNGVPYVVPVPDRYYFWTHAYNLFHSIHGGIPFDMKIDKIVYAGNDRGSKYNFLTRRDINMSQREYFRSYAVYKGDYIHTQLNLERSKMIEYKYILDIDGNSSTWDATAWKLNSGSVIFKTDSVWKSWFYDEYKPWVHYIPVNDDFSNIIELFHWCQNNRTYCLEMINNCKKLFKKIYNYAVVSKYTEDVFFKINRLIPSYYNNRRVFFITTDTCLKSNSYNLNVPLNYELNENTTLVKELENINKKLFDNDIVIVYKSENIDSNLLDERLKKHLNVVFEYIVDNRPMTIMFKQETVFAYEVRNFEELKVIM